MIKKNLKKKLYNLTIDLNKTKINKTFSNQSIQPLNKKTSYPSLEAAYLTSQLVFINWLYRNGYYLSYLNLYQNLNKKFFDSRNIQNAIHYTKQKINLKDQLLDNSKISLKVKKLFHNNQFKKIISNPQNKIHTDYYLLSLAALSQWNKFDQFLNHYPQPIKKEFIFIKTLFTQPINLEEMIKKSPISSLTSWQLDYLNLIGEGNSPKQIAKIIIAGLLKKNKLETFSKETQGMLSEYAIVLFAKNTAEIGKIKEVERLFRKYYNSMTHNQLKEQLMFIYGRSHLIVNPKTGKEIFFKLLTINPQSPLRFEIEEALKLFL